METLSVGMYVRTKEGTINKIFEIDKFLKHEEEDRLVVNEDDWFLVESDLTKASHNIIDLIEVGDYVNGRLVEYTTNEFIAFGRLDYLYEKDIKSIVTKEQFESMSYKVED
jgi:hypothetical protein